MIQGCLGGCIGGFIGGAVFATVSALYIVKDTTLIDLVRNIIQYFI